MIKIIAVSCISFLFFSCKFEGSKCEREKEMYNARWDYIVKKVYRDTRYNATYVIETTSGERLAFQPIQTVASISEPGDKLIKKAYDERVYIITPEGDTFNSKIFSETCDKFILKEIRKDSVSNDQSEY